MVLPVLRTLSDCADYHKTIEPYLPQLYALPQKLLDNGASIHGLQQIYAETNPFMFAFSVSVFIGAAALVGSEIMRNYSQIDCLWSIVPNLYIVHFAVWARVAGLPHSRLDLMAVATTIWSVRLTYNYWRKGGYDIGAEDYRWKIIMSKVNGFVFFLFNVTFISFIQSILLFLFSGSAAYIVLLTTQFEPEITTADLGYFGFILALIFSEWVSDGQQWNYQTAKYKYLETGKVPAGFAKADLDRGFITSGMWAYSRHPNFFAEQAIWFVLYQWSCFASSSLYSWAGVGSLSLILLFQGSTSFTESISAGKYPAYADYQKQVGVFFPTSLSGYKPSGPKVIRTSELAKSGSKAKKN